MNEGHGMDKGTKRFHQSGYSQTHFGSLPLVSRSVTRILVDEISSAKYGE